MGREVGIHFTATYDAENRLSSLTYKDGKKITQTFQYTYSGDGLPAIVKRLENGVVKEETRFVRDGGLIIQERNAKNAVTRQYAWGLHLGGGIGGLLNHRRSGKDYAYLYDASGNVEAVLNALQQVVAAYRYDPFGTRLAKTGTFEQPFQFSTKRADARIGMVQYEYRNYLPSIGRWLTRDPLGEAGGLNLYAFVGNNPVNWVDPWGLAVGHHFFPRCIFTKAGLPPDVVDFFEHSVTGRVPGGHGWNLAHKNYNDAIRNLWQQYLRQNGINPANMTLTQAQNFLNMIRNSQIPAIRNFLQSISSLQSPPTLGPTLFIMINPCFLPSLSPSLCPTMWPSPSDT